jgi:betaine-aldehyde dehydrogenase
VTQSATTVLDLTDPRTGAKRGQCTVAGEAEVTEVVSASRKAGDAWAAMPPRQRSRQLSRLADRIEEKAAEYVDRERAGTGKPAPEAAAEIAQVADLFRFYAGAARGELTPAGGGYLPGHESWVRWEPMGVVGVIVPWNYPLLMAAWRCAPALAAGNAVVLKPAETTPDTAQLLEIDAADVLGPDILRTVTGGRQTGQFVVDSGVDAIAFTGSTRGGEDVAQRAGVRRISLELGGNCPAVVLADAPPFTWAALVGASTYNAGQSCVAPARVIVVRERYDEAVAELSEAVSARCAGRDFGPLNNPEQVRRYDELLKASAAGGRRDSAVMTADAEVNGFWRPACVLADLPEDDPAVVHEVFGPVLTVQAADTPDDALRLANSMPQALAASVWSTDVGSALEAARRLRVGEAWVNCHLVQTAELPHGGRGVSGAGTDLSVLALAEYQRPKTVTVRLATSRPR